MARTLVIAATLSLLIAPVVWAQDAADDPPPAAGDIQLELERLFGESPPPALRQDRQIYLVVPDVRGVQGSWTCSAAADRQSPEAQAACDFGRELSRLEPCTRPEDCQALDLWTRQVGPPSLRQARPSAEIRRPAVIITHQGLDEAQADPESGEDEN